MKFKNRQNTSTVSEMRTVVTSGGDNDLGGAEKRLLGYWQYFVFVFWGWLHGLVHLLEIRTSDCTFLNVIILQKTLKEIILNNKNNGNPLLLGQHFIIYKLFSHMLSHSILSLIH